jgi:bifunctional DNA-binding transcriptional regulator/antitoxin component of YhaV-PrlF toxin-antitoxin module
MAEIIEADASGRIVIPKSIRVQLHMNERTKFLLTRSGEGQLLLQKLDVDEIARRLEVELAGRDVDGVVTRVREEANRKIKAQYPDLSA